MGVFDRAGTKETDGAPPVQPPAQPTDTIEIGQGEHIVIARTKVMPEDEQWVMNRLLNILANQGRQKMSESEQLRLADRLWLQRLIVSWTLPIPLETDRAKAIGRLSQSDRDYLYKTIMAAQPKKEMQLGLGVRGPSSAMQEALQKRSRRFGLLNT